MSRPLSPQLARRRELRQRKRRELAVQTWRVVICLLLGSGLGWLLLRHGWTMDSIDRIVISGNTGLRALSPVFPLITILSMLSMVHPWRSNNQPRPLPSNRQITTRHV